MSSRRRFTEREDDLIRQQASGNMTFARLMHLTRSTREALSRRARELGVTPLVREYGKTHAPEHENRHRPAREEAVEDRYYADSRPAQIENDLLLERLQKIHGDRTFGS